MIGFNVCAKSGVVTRLKTGGRLMTASCGGEAGVVSGNCQYRGAASGADRIHAIRYYVEPGYGQPWTGEAGQTNQVRATGLRGDVS